MPGQVILEDVRLIYRNFSGMTRRFNEDGQRKFSVILDEETALKLEADRWNIKKRDPIEEGDPPLYLINVNVKYRRRDGKPTNPPPMIVLITSRGKTMIGEDLIAMLDWADIIHVDLILNPYEYEPGRFTAYLKSIYVTIREDPLELKYLDVPDSESAQALLVQEGDGA